MNTMQYYQPFQNCIYAIPCTTDISQKTRTYTQRTVYSYRRHKYQILRVSVKPRGCFTPNLCCMFSGCTNSATGAICQRMTQAVLVCCCSPKRAAACWRSTSLEMTSCANPGHDKVADNWEVTGQLATFPRGRVLAKSGFSVPSTRVEVHIVSHCVNKYVCLFGRVCVGGMRV